MKLFFYKSIVLFFIITLCACSKSYPVHETELVYITPPAVLLEPLTVPFFTGTTNEDLLLYTLSLEKKVQLCNSRFEAIKKSIAK